MKVILIGNNTMVIFVVKLANAQVTTQTLAFIQMAAHRIAKITLALALLMMQIVTHLLPPNHLQVGH
jgi:hypothetical protein